MHINVSSPSNSGENADTMRKRTVRSRQLCSSWLNPMIASYALKKKNLNKSYLITIVSCLTIIKMVQLVVTLALFKSGNDGRR